MPTRLDKTLKRSLRLKGEEFILALSPRCLKIVRKGHRKGLELGWMELINGDAALAVALNASLGKLARAASGTNAGHPSGKAPGSSPTPAAVRSGTRPARKNKRTSIASKTARRSAARRGD